MFIIQENAFENVVCEMQAIFLLVAAQQYHTELHMCGNCIAFVILWSSHC